MKNHFQPFLLLALVVASFPALHGYQTMLEATPPAPSLSALQGYRRTLQDTPPAPAPYTGNTTAAPGSSATPLAPPPAVPAPVPAPPQLPPPTGSVVPQENGGGSSGLSGGQKAGIVIGVMAGAGLIWLATIVYMKRRSNIRRARFGVFARRSQL